MIFQPDFDDSSIPLAEYPRPQLRRDSYLSLNGEWDCTFCSSAQPPKSYDCKIIVPFSPESPLSGVNRQLKPDEYLHYKRTFTLPQDFNRGRIIVNFGACDQRCKVYCNGAQVGGHEGGYLPFSFDITPHIREGENTLCVAVADDASSDVYGRGKQSYTRGGIWYTAISGLWQSVWIESVPQIYIKNLQLVPDYASNTLTVTVFCDGGEIPVNCTVYDGEKAICSRAGVPCNSPFTLDVSACKLWSPDSPELYSLKITCGDDIVYSYFGLRTFSRVRRSGRYYLAVNGHPIFQSGLLDQGYWGKGIYTPATNAEMYNCLKQVKALGFNMLRKHIKVEPLLWYYYCDVLGILVWQDMLNGGERYLKRRLNLGPFINLHLNDKNYKSMGRANELSRRQYVAEAEQTIATLFNCVSICLWTLFNEGWGQFDSLDMWNKMRALDFTRLYDPASGWQDTGGGDVNSKHVYFKKIRLKNDGKRALALTEFGGYSYSGAGGKKAFSYRNFSSPQKFMRALERLYEKQVVPAIVNDGLCAAVYTQLSDVEDEVNGLFTPDWRCKVDAQSMRKINESLYSAFLGSLK